MKFPKITISCFLAISSCLSSCMADKVCHPELMAECMVYGKAGSNLDAYFEAEEDSSETAKKIRDVNREKGVTIHLVSKNFTPGSKYYLHIARIDGSLVPMFQVAADEKGQLVTCEAHSTRLENILLNSQGCMLGEEIYYILVSEDGFSYLSTSASSNPIRVTAKDNAHISVKMLTPLADSFLAQGKDFLPKEIIEMKVTFADEHSVYAIEANEAGKWQLTFKIPLEKFPGGLGTFTISRQNGEVISGEYAWGNKSRGSCKG